MLSTLAGRGFCSADINGQIIVNGRVFKGYQWNGCSVQNNYYKSSIGYVPQEDVVYSELTVFENLYFSGRLQHRKNSKDIKVLTRNVVKSLGEFSVIFIISLP